MASSPPQTDKYARQGFLVVPDLIETADLEALRAEADRILDESSQRGGARVPLDRSPLLSDLANHGPVAELARRLIGNAARPVKLTIFDKSPAANWVVPRHQDVTIAVHEKREVDGFGPWSMKDGIPHVQPPAEVLERILAIRVHLDDTPESNGALRVVPGSHRHGKLGSESARALREELGEVVCEVEAGGGHAMSPLLLHASSKAESPARRRVVHIEYASADLPGGLDWA